MTLLLPLARRLLPVTLLLPALACGSPNESALDRARAEGVIAGFSVEPPYAMVDATGRVTGHSPELLRYAAAEAGIHDIQWFPLEFHQLIPAVLAGRIDVVASGMFITPGRSQLVRFSKPTVCVRPVLISPAARNGGTGGDADQAECRDCRIAVVGGSVEQDALTDSRAVGTLLVVPDVATGIAAAKRGGADGLAISAPTGRAIVRDDPTLSASALTLPAEVQEHASGCAALAFRPSDEALAAAVDSVLNSFTGSLAHRRIAEPFGFEPSELP